MGLDVMGGDFAPEAPLKGAILAHENFDKTDSIVLFGDEVIIRKQMSNLNSDPDNFTIVHTSEVIGMSEHRTRAFKSKQDSSITKGFRMLREGKYRRFCQRRQYGGDAGGFYTCGKYCGRHLRPATAAVFPRVGGGSNIIT
ncbi:MAG: hypothetical protein U5L09_07280 [Bacteroidales bacterium]|nr:hypothetical protein [Bacteroidales bacterium]